jgi:hypothetical protein
VKSIILRFPAVLVFSLALSPVAAATEKTIDSLAILRRTLNERELTAITERNTAVGREIHYCPDSTCNIFKASNAVSRRVLDDFAFTYIFHASGYTYLRDFVMKTARPYARVILERNRSRCADEEELDLASCVLRSAAQQYSIRVFEARDDEGVRTEAAVDLESKIAVSELKRARAWQLEQWCRRP